MNAQIPQTKLSPQQEAFAQAIATGMNQSDAYRTAYPKSVNWLPTTLWAKASSLMADEKVSTRIGQLRAPAVAKVDITLERILRENARIAFSDIRNIFDDNGNLKPVKDWDDQIAASVSAVEVSNVRTVNADGEVLREESRLTKIKLWDKGAALDKLFKHAGLYAKDHQQAAEKLQTVEAMLLEIANIGRGLPARVGQPITDIEIER